MEYGKVYLMINVLDEFIQECLAITIDQKFKQKNVVNITVNLFILWWFPVFNCRDNSPEIVAQVLETNFYCQG